MTRQDAAQLEEMTRYSGTIAQLDADSPVYVALDGTCYEATPAGAGEGAFTLYAPAASAGEVFYRLEGQWICSEAVF